jgi:7-cyano-7-deazaguanine reductase
MVELKTVPNEARCAFTKQEHELPIDPCCPVSGNPRPGSLISIAYEPIGRILEVASLRAYIDSYKGGRGDVRSMEGMIQAIAQDCSNAVRAHVIVNAELVIEPRQKMRLKCAAFPESHE